MTTRPVLAVVASVCLLWCLIPGGASAAELEQRRGQASLRVQADKVNAGIVEVRLSGKLIVALVVEGRAALEVQPLQTLTVSPDWEVSRKSEPETTTLTDGRFHWQQMFSLSPTKPGDVPLALVPLRYRGDDTEEQWQEAAWKPITVRVTTEILNPDLSELRDVTPPEEVPSPLSWRVPLLYGAGIALGVAGLLFVAWKSLRRSRRPVVLPADQWALRELERIDKLDLATASTVERFHTLLADVVRKYLELRFQFPAPEQTTAEFLQAIRGSTELTAEQQAALRELLEHCDLVKFARAEPPVEACQAMSARARAFVQETATKELPNNLRDPQMTV
jgi:hypothetical protein